MFCLTCFTELFISVKGAHLQALQIQRFDHCRP